MREPLTVGPLEPATRIRKLFRDTLARVVVVADEEGRLLGWIKRPRLLVITSTKSEALARDLMEDPPFTLSENNTVGDAFKLMTKYDEWYGVVVGSSWRIRGIVGMEDIIRLGLEEERDKLENIRVSDYMSKNVVYARVDDSISKLWRLMQSLGYAGLPVVNDKGKLVGIITQYDLIRKGYTRIELESESGPRPGARVRDAMTYSVVYLYPWSTVAEAAEVMVKRGFGRIPVVDGPRSRILVGVIDREDVARAVVGH
jgi:CBS domain-containing protein